MAIDWREIFGLTAHMRQELLSEDDILSLLREQGIDDLRDVSEAYLEPDGQMSVLKARDDDSRRGRGKRAPGAGGSL